MSDQPDNFSDMKELELLATRGTPPYERPRGDQYYKIGEFISKGSNYKTLLSKHFLIALFGFKPIATDLYDGNGKPYHLPAWEYYGLETAKILLKGGRSAVHYLLTEKRSKFPLKEEVKK